MDMPASDPTADRVLELLAQAKQLAREYRALTGKPLGVTGEVAEYEVASARPPWRGGPSTTGSRHRRRLRRSQLLPRHHRGRLHALPLVTGGGPASVAHPMFRWVNTVIGNVKNALHGTYCIFNWPPAML